MAMIFQKPALRTRVSFDMAMRHLGGDALYLSPAKSVWVNVNPLPMLPECFPVMLNAIMARVFDHEHVVELGKMVQCSGDQWAE